MNYSGYLQTIVLVGALILNGFFGCANPPASHAKANPPPLKSVPVVSAPTKITHVVSQRKPTLQEQFQKQHRILHAQNQNLDRLALDVKKVLSAVKNREQGAKQLPLNVPAPKLEVPK